MNDDNYEDDDIMMIANTVFSNRYLKYFTYIISFNAQSNFMNELLVPSL